jgi:hypothetical protein
MFITGVNDTGNKLFTGVNDTSDTFIAGGFSVIAADKFLAGVNDKRKQLSPVTVTPPINLLPVTRTRMLWRCGAAKIGES